MSILSKMGIKMKKEDGEALKKSADEVKQLIINLGVPKEGEAPSPPPNGAK